MGDCPLFEGVSGFFSHSVGSSAQALRSKSGKIENSNFCLSWVKTYSNLDFSRSVEIPLQFMQLLKNTIKFSLNEQRHVRYHSNPDINSVLKILEVNSM